MRQPHMGANVAAAATLAALIILGFIALPALLGVIALRVEGKLEYDAAKMRFTNNAAANQYLKPAFRKGWSLT